MTIKMSRTKLSALQILGWLFPVFLVPTLVLGTTDISQLARPTGRVSLFSFERGHLRTVSEGIDTEVVLTAAPRYFEAYLFECNATYPVQWAYIGEAAPVVTADVGRFFQDFYDVTTYTYQSILLMYSLQEMQSGRYICRGASKEHDKLAIHYDVFVPGNGTQILLSTSEKKLFIPETKEHAYIPCGVSDSTAAVNLYRGNQWGTFYPVPANGSITFNPRKGFKIRFKDFLDPWGTYLCVSESNKKRRKVHLIPESLKAKYDMINHVSGKIPVYFSYEYEYNRVLCCTGTNYLPKLQWAGCGSILDCQVKSACFEEDRCEQRLGNSGFNPTKWIDPGPLPPGCSGYRLRDDPNGDFGLFKCSTPGIAQYQPYLLNRGNIFLDFEKTPPSEMILTLQRISPEGPSFVGDEVEFHCNSTRFYFAYGIRWGWEKVSGEIEFIDDAAVIRDKYSIRGHRRRTTLKIPYPDVKSVICFVPVVNSATEWRTVSLPVVIASSDVNFISHQNNNNNNKAPAPQNVIDLDSITYHTDYDDGANTVSVHPQQQNDHQQQPPQIIPIQHQQNPIPVQQPNPQVYNSAKTPYQEIQGVVHPTSTQEQNRHQNNANYYSYTHDDKQGIPDTHIYQQHSNDIHSHQSRIHPIAQAHTASNGYSHQPSTSIPNIIAISRSKKNRNRPGSTTSTGSQSSSRSDSRVVPNSKPDVQYDTIDKDFAESSHDAYEPRPTKSNTRHHHTSSRSHSHPQSSSKLQTLSTRVPYHQHSPSPSSSHSHSHSRRPSSSSSTSSSRKHNNNYSQTEAQHSTSKKPYQHYNNYNEKTEFGVDARLALPFEPASSSSKSRHSHSHSHGSNYSTIPADYSHSSSSSSRGSSHSDRSHSRRPASSSHSHSHSSARPHHRHDERHRSRPQPEKDYTIDDSHSKYVRLSLPANSISTHAPKYEKGSSGSRNPHGRSRGHHHSTSPHDASSSHSQIADYYYTDDSPVEIKLPQTKSHDDSYRTRSRQDPRHHYSQSHGSSHSHGASHSHPSDEVYRDVTVIHEPPSQTYLRKQPYSSNDHGHHSTFSQATTAQPFVYRKDHPTYSGHSSGSSPHYSHQTQSYLVAEHQPAKYYYTHGASSGHQAYPKTSGRHRSYGRGMKLDDDAPATAVEGGTVADAYEYTSPTARPAFYLSTPLQTPQNSNEFINAADMELKRVQPYHRSRTTTTSSPEQGSKLNSTAADIMHSVSISISSRVSLDKNGNQKENQLSLSSHLPQEQSAAAVESPRNEIQETEDYDIYSPQYTNYKPSTVLPPVSMKPVVPIQFFAKPSDKSSFQPAKSIIDEDDEDYEIFG